MNESIAAFCLLVGLHQAVLEPIVAKLGDEDFYEREKAHLFIEQQLKVPWEEFLVEGLRKPRQDLETKSRINSLTEKWDDLLTDYGKYPWIDALPVDYPDKERIITKYINQRGHVDQQESYRYMTYLWLTDLKKQGWWTSSLRNLQREMIVNEEYYHKNSHYPWNNEKK